MRDLGLEQLGAQLSLLGRQITTSINAMLPEELALFGCACGARSGAGGAAAASPPVPAPPLPRLPPPRWRLALAAARSFRALLALRLAFTPRVLPLPPKQVR